MVPPADGGSYTANVQPTDISQLVAQQLFTYYDAFPESGIDLLVELAEGPKLGTIKSRHIVQNI